MRQISKSQRRLAAGAFLIIAAPIVATSVAYACQTLATLHANPRETTAGSTVAVRGQNYSSNASSTPIEIRLDGRAGRLLASFSPRSTLNNEPVAIPADVAAGTHTLLATQYLSSGAAVSGTPGRASLVITVAARTTSDGAGAGGGAASTASTDSATATPVAATPADVAPAVDAPSAPAVSGGAATGTATQRVAPAPATAAATNSVASAPATADGPTPGGPAAPTGAPAAAAAAAAEPTASAAGPASVNVGLLPASASDSPSSLPGLALAAGLAMVLLALGAFLKTGRNMLSQGATPLAG